MKKISLSTPFLAPVYYKERTVSTMADARLLAAQGEPHGTVVIAGVQEAGRGRIPGRSWTAGPGEGLLFTILLRYQGFSAIPEALTLRTGLALSLAIEDFAPPLKGLVSVKWPNDIMIGSPQAQSTRKAAGILTEGDGETVFIGIGVNMSQGTFPQDFRSWAVSIALALEEVSPGGSSPGKAAPDKAPAGKLVPGRPALGPEGHFTVLEKILARLSRELDSAQRDPPGGPGPAGEIGLSWRSRLEERLYLRGRPVRFIPGGADSGDLVEGILQGIGPGGELLILPPGASQARSFITGELDLRDSAGTHSAE
jgi:BirA family biotin operon repressor/biotin-[acetyl-CoA-carboxylase] ligase